MEDEVEYAIPGFTTITLDIEPFVTIGLTIAPVPAPVGSKTSKSGIE